VVHNSTLAFSTRTTFLSRSPACFLASRMKRLALPGGGPGIDDEHRLGRTGLFQPKRIAGRDDRHHAQASQGDVVERSFIHFPAHDGVLAGQVISELAKQGPVQTSQVRASMYCPEIPAAETGRRKDRKSHNS